MKGQLVALHLTSMRAQNTNAMRCRAVRRCRNSRRCYIQQGPPPRMLHQVRTGGHVNRSSHSERVLSRVRLLTCCLPVAVGFSEVVQAVSQYCV